MTSLYASGSVVSVRAILLGERIDLKGLESTQRLATNPLLISAGEGQYAALFRYGAVVLFGVNSLQEVTFVDQLARLVGQPYPKRETEETRLRVDPAGEERAEGGEIVLREASVGSLQVIADVLAKSVVLGYYEASLAAIFDAVEPFAQGLKGGGRTTPKDRDLLRYVGDTLLTQHKMVGRVEVGEKPDVLWELPGLARLFSRLEDEYELQERKLGVDRKLDLITRTVETQVDLLQNKRALRVEWYIVILIVIEILLSLYQLFLARR
ncbi:MAG TPA: RMD1 family protein [Vicinamibacteria bacterium]|nr:RMD1 family protein [Vicinamibacteria bacterium]